MSAAPEHLEAPWPPQSFDAVEVESASGSLASSAAAAPSVRRERSQQQQQQQQQQRRHAAVGAAPKAAAPGAGEFKNECAMVAPLTATTIEADLFERTMTGTTAASSTGQHTPVLSTTTAAAAAVGGGGGGGGGGASSGGGSERAGTTTVITPRIIRTPQGTTPRGAPSASSREYQGGAEAGGGGAASPFTTTAREHLPFAGLTTVSEEQDAARLELLRAPSASASRADHDAHYQLSVARLRHDALAPVTDFASRSEILDNVAAADALRRDGLARAEQLSAALEKALRSTLEAFKQVAAGGAAGATPSARMMSQSSSPDAVASSSPSAAAAVSAQRKQQEQEDGSFKASGGVVMVPALVSHTRKARERELRRLSRQVRELKEKNVETAAAIVVATQRLEAASKRASLLRASQADFHAVEASLTSLDATAAARVAYLEGLLALAREEHHIHRARSASRQRPHVTASDVAERQRRVDALSAEVAHLRQQQDESAALAAAAKQKAATAVGAAGGGDVDNGAPLTKDAMERERAAKHDVARLREHLAKVRREHLYLLKERALLLSHSGGPSQRAAVRGFDGDGSQLDVDIPLELLQELMARLKATVINFATDLRKAWAVRQLDEARQELMFKAAHNEVKVALSLCLPAELAKKLNSAATTGEWPVTPQVIAKSFPPHKLEQTHVALQEMVITWDSLPLSAKRRLTTARDVISNAHILFELALHVERQRFVKWSSKIAGMASAYSPPGGSGGGGGAAREGPATARLPSHDRFHSFRRSHSGGSQAHAADPEPTTAGAALWSGSFGTAPSATEATTPGSPMRRSASPRGFSQQRHHPTGGSGGSSGSPLARTSSSLTASIAQGTRPSVSGGVSSHRHHQRWAGADGDVVAETARASSIASCSGGGGGGGADPFGRFIIVDGAEGCDGSPLELRRLQDARGNAGDNGSSPGGASSPKSPPVVISRLNLPPRTSD